MNTKLILDNLSKKNVCNMDITEINFDLGNNKDKMKTINNLSKLFDSYINFNKNKKIYI